MSAQPTKKTRAEINRENARKSTGPRTQEGKAASARNSFKHGIYSTQVVVPGEDPAQYEALLADLRAEHQPATPTEEILVDELAQHFWHIKRYRLLETDMYLAQGSITGGRQSLDVANLLKYVNTGLFNLIHRSLASAERNFHRALSTLLRLRKHNGFVPSEPRAKASGITAKSASTGFVPAKHFEAVSTVASFDENLPEFPSPISTKAA